MAYPPVCVCGERKRLPLCLIRELPINFMIMGCMNIYTTAEAAAAVHIIKCTVHGKLNILQTGFSRGTEGIRKREWIIKLPTLLIALL